MSCSLNQMYAEVGISKQAVAQYGVRQQAFDQNVQQLILGADDLREDQPGCGVEKMYHTLNPGFIGRDRFLVLMMALGYRLAVKKNYHRTTFASKIYFPNLIKGMKIDHPSVVWQSDITYIQVGGKHYYAVFIIDVYTKKIVGFKVSDNMRGQANIDAFSMALADNGAPLFHHSDRGSQYTYKLYVALLLASGCKVSMALTAQDNAYAERINRTIKEEYLDHWKPNNFKELKEMTARAVDSYNNRRIHDRLGRMAPNAFIEQWKELTKEERPIEKIYDNGEP